MEHSLASLAYKGSIPEAIAEAKIQKKLFVVYISGEDADSIRMENSTWVASKVSETISKYCILLNVAAGSADATNFSRIYPQKYVPCITAVGYNGVQICQNDGFIDAENLSSILEKAWLSLHIQETTASVMAAALAGRTLESSTSGASPVALNEQGSSSNSVPPPSDGHYRSSEATPSLIVEEKRHGGESVVKEERKSSSEKLKEASSSTGEQSHDSGHDNQKNMGNQGPSSKAKAKHLPEITEGSDSTRGSVVLLEEKLGSFKEVIETDAVQILPASSKSSDVYLNIRLPDGMSLQDKFPITSTLRAVKDYIDENQTNGNGYYDLAVPYPRKVFNDQDLSKSLEELELLGRQALIVIPREKGRGNTSRGGAPISYTQPDSSAVDLSNRNNEGYFAYARRVLSYFNPFSYLGGGGNGGSSSPGQESRASTSEYRPNNNLRSSYAAQERPNSQGSTSQDTIRSRKPTISRFGSNIHTLKHDDDETQFRDRNAFWNGNSTQYGGDNNDSK